MRSPLLRSRLAIVEKRDQGVAEWLAVQAYNGDSAGAHVNLGVYYTERGDAVRAEAEYLTARKLEPYFAPAAVNLADLYRTSDRDADGERVLRDALTLAPEAADLHHSLGLLLVRRKDIAGALVELKRAAELAADDPDAQYTYAVALYSSGRLADAIALLDKTWRAHPGDRQVLAALVSYVREQGDGVRARDLASRLVALSPGDPTAAGLFEEIRKESQ